VELRGVQGFCTLLKIYANHILIMSGWVRDTLLFADPEMVVKSVVKF